MADPVTAAETAQTLITSPVVGYSTGAVVATATIAWIIRMLRRDLRDANLDRAYDKMVEALQKDLNGLRERLDISEQKYATLNANFVLLTRENQALRQENKRLHEEIAAARAASTAAHTEIISLQMQSSGQLATIEDLQTKVRNLEAANLAAAIAGRRKSDGGSDG